MLKLKRYKDNLIVHKDTMLNAISNTKDPNSIYQVRARDAKGHRIVKNLIPKNIDEHDPEYIRLGYLTKHYKGGNSVTFPITKTNQKLRKIFGFTDKKTKYTLDSSEFNKDQLSLKNILSFDNEQFDAFICGIAYDMSIKKKGRYSSGGLKIYLPQQRDFESETTILNDEFIDRLKNTCCNGLREINSPFDYEYFIENIGVINPAKMTRILESYYSKAYVITAIEKVDNA